MTTIRQYKGKKLKVEIKTCKILEYKIKEEIYSFLINKPNIIIKLL